MMFRMNPIQRRPVILIAILLGCAAIVSAAEIRVGSLEGNSAVFTATPVTIIDWTRPATGSGSVNTASVAWTKASSPCDGIFFVRFYAIPGNALVTTMTAERGPFRAVNGINTVALEPPVSVTTETYIGVRRGAGAESCGQPYGTFTRQAGRALFSGDDFKGGSLTALSPSGNFHLQAQASNVPSVRVATLPVAGSVAGNFGSFFRTSLTLANPSTDEIRGKLLFRPAGKAGSDTDPSLDFVIPSNGTLNYADVIASLGQTGLGSLDILTTASATPLASARVFNDAGSAGTSGLAEEAVPAAPNYLSVASVLIPEDLTNYRLNIGIRTITAADLNVTVYDKAGLSQGFLVKSYPADFFEQVSASSFINGGTLPAGGRIVVSAFQKEFIVYGAVTDNRTNDPSVRIGSD
jgi:hypothetical protein